MRPLCVFTLATCLVFVVPPCAAQSAEPWLPITPEDLTTKDVPGPKGAPAIRLYYSYFRNDEKKFELRYERIKVLNEAGKRYADVEIPLEPKDVLKELKARTIHSDGSIVEFTGKPFEKTLLKTRGVKYLAETFTLPEVTLGSIVEYSYALNMGDSRLGRVTEWELQGDLFTVKEHFRFQPVVGFLGPRPEYNAPGPPRAQVACDYQNQKGAPIPQRGKDGLRELELTNVAPFETEDLMPPESNYRASMLCYYGGGFLFSYNIFWQSMQNLISEGTDKFIGNLPPLREAAAGAIGNETDPEQKLRKLYALVQQVRNISYEAERTKKEGKGDKLKHNNNASDVLRHGYGDSWEIDALFTGLARAAGFDASMMMVSDRYERSFNRFILWLGQLSGSAVLVKLDGKPMILDPGTRFCPFGVLAPRYSETTAFVIKTGEPFLKTPAAQSSSMRRVVEITFSPDGSAKGQMNVEFKGPRALQERIDALFTDEPGRRTGLEEEVTTWLPSGAKVSMTASDGWTSSEEPLTAKFSIEIPSLASVTGKRLIVPAYVLSSSQNRLFAGNSRSYPIDFGYPFSQKDEVRLQFPEGYSLEGLPHPRKAELPWAAYEFAPALEGTQFVARRALRLDKSLVLPDDYSRLKSVFDVVQAGDSSQAVIQLKDTAKN